MRPRDGVLGVILGAVLTAAVILGAPALAVSPPGASRARANAPKEDFMFQVMNYRTRNQGGQTLNFYLHYRYRNGLPTSKYPNYLNIRRMLLAYMGREAPKQHVFWEILNTQICSRIKNSFPLQAISCQFQVHSDKGPGLPYAPGSPDSIVTIGNIEPLAIPGP